MHIDISSKLVAIAIGVVFLVAPFIVWLVLYILVKKCLFKPGALLPWLARIRWVIWTSALLFYVGSFVSGRSHWIYGGAILVFSSGLSFPEGWLRKQVAHSDAFVS